LDRAGENYRLVIAGRIKECAAYWKKIEGLIQSHGLADRVLTDLRHVPDEDIETYLKAADVMVLPYRDIFQSGALFLTYRFGLPVIAADVGSFREDIEAAQAGLVFEPNNPTSLAGQIEKYFAGELYQDLESSRRRIRDYAVEQYSWERIGGLTRAVYERALGTSNRAGKIN
jgi:glycosyltransferase involved in cell wall biosynthesis